MKVDTQEIISQMYDKYTGNSFHMVLMAIAIIYLLVTARKRKENIVFLVFTLLFTLLYCWSFTAKILQNLIGYLVYWRMFWLLPEILVIAFSGASLLGHLKKYKSAQLVTLAVLLVLIGVGGSCIYAQGYFQEADNLYKLPYPTTEICDAITTDAQKEGIDDILAVVPNNLLCYVRQYDTSIKLPYGRDVFRGRGLSHNHEAIYSQMSSDDADPETLDWVLRKEGCNYFVWDKSADAISQFEGYEFVLIAQFDGYYVFRMDYGEETLARMKELEIAEEEGLISVPEATVTPEAGEDEDYDPESLS